MLLPRLERFIAEATARLDELAEMGLRSWVEEAAALHLLQVQAQALLDLVMHLAAELGYAPETPKAAAEALAREGLMTGDDVGFVKRVAGFRNIVINEYAGVDMEMVRGILAGREYRRVAALAARLILEARRRGLDP